MQTDRTDATTLETWSLRDQVQGLQARLERAGHREERLRRALEEQPTASELEAMRHETEEARIVARGAVSAIDAAVSAALERERADHTAALDALRHAYESSRSWRIGRAISRPFRRGGSGTGARG